MGIRTELTVQLQNTPGALSRACQTLGDERVNILGLCLERAGTLRVVVDNPLHAAGILRERDYLVESRDVLYIQLPNDPGTLARVSRLLGSAGVNVEYAYGTVVEGETMAVIVVGVEDAQRASAAAGV